MNEKEENILELDKIYDILKNHPYVNDVTIKNGKSFMEEFSRIWYWAFSDKSDKYFYWHESRVAKSPELALLVIESHDINSLNATLREETLEIHHRYMMDILDVLRSYFNEGAKIKYFNTRVLVKVNEHWKWRCFLYTYKEIEPGKWKGINCIPERQVESIIEKYNKRIEYYKSINNLRYADFCLEELVDLQLKNGEYHIIIPDEDWDKYFINYNKNE